MNFKEFSSLYVSRLSNENMYGLCTSTISMAQNSQEGIGTLLQAILEQLVSAHKKLTGVIKKNKGSQLTTEVADADNARDMEHNSIKRTLVFYSQDDDEGIKNAAQTLKQFFQPYWDCNDKPMDTQTALTKEMIEKYKANADLTGKAAQVNVAARFEKLEQLNNRFDELYKNRNTEKANSNSPSASSLRPEVDTLYTKFCQAVELEVNFTPSDIVTQVFGELDNLRKKYSVLAN